MHRIETGAHQIAYRFVRGVRNPYCRQFARSMQASQTGCIPPIRLDPVARTSWDQRGSNDDTFMAALRNVTLNAIAARPRLLSFRHSVK
jgi:hypothetical protein